MSEPTQCNQDGCAEPAAFRFTWPGRDEAGICARHREQAERIASAMGFPLQFIALKAEA